MKKIIEKNLKNLSSWIMIRNFYSPVLPLFTQQQYFGFGELT